MPRKTLRILRIALWGLVLLTGLAATRLFLPAPPDPQETLAAVDLGQGDYRLETTEGQPFTEASLKGQPSLVFFGFTHCPDVCPTTMGEIMGWKDDLGPLADGLKVWFVTVDPERDTPEVLRDYVSWLPGATGVTGSVEETAKALMAFRISARKVPLKDGGYSMDHSASVMLFDREGRYSQFFSYRDEPERVTTQLRRLLESQG
ncbi:SCO family protein [Paracoccus sp. S3-43]|uniref:SCO family protein n=1 Tax=Paracoccus sp. S3-43 TaxID=3030011 RepID=UPI0023B1995D|nr:SCO family protein [Paracoccus sp. S3-43]WEF24845.1 SCO family protein [Paracoccus sp. S3-43]